MLEAETSNTSADPWFSARGHSQGAPGPGRRLSWSRPPPVPPAAPPRQATHTPPEAASLLLAPPWDNAPLRGTFCRAFNSIAAGSRLPRSDLLTLKVIMQGFSVAAERNEEALCVLNWGEVTWARQGLCARGWIGWGRWEGASHCAKPHVCTRPRRPACRASLGLRLQEEREDADELGMRGQTWWQGRASSRNLEVAQAEQEPRQGPWGRVFGSCFRHTAGAVGPVSRRGRPTCTPGSYVAEL